MVLIKIFELFVIYFCPVYMFCVAPAEQNYSDVPLAGATGSPLRALSNGSDGNCSDVSDHVPEQLENERKKNSILESKLVDKDNLLRRQTDAINILKVDIDVYQSALTGDLLPLRNYIEKYKDQLVKLRAEDPSDNKITKIEAKVQKLANLLTRCGEGATLSAGDDSDLVSLRAELEAVKAEREKCLVPKAELDAFMALCAPIDRQARMAAARQQIEGADKK